MRGFWSLVCFCLGTIKGEMEKSKRKTMRRRLGERGAFVVFVGYVWSKTLAGLAIHPYRSVKEMVMERKSRVLLPTVLSPLFGVLGLLVLGRVGSLVFEVGGLARRVLGFVLVWGFLGVLMWQGLILVLVWRFFRALR